jgi:hypothetical protein
LVVGLRDSAAGANARQRLCELVAAEVVQVVKKRMERRRQDLFMCLEYLVQISYNSTLILRTTHFNFFPTYDSTAPDWLIGETHFVSHVAMNRQHKQMIVGGIMCSTLIKLANAATFDIIISSTIILYPCMHTHLDKFC